MRNAPDFCRRIFLFWRVSRSSNSLKSFDRQASVGAALAEEHEERRRQRNDESEHHGACWTDQDPAIVSPRQTDDETTAKLPQD